jgi:hypothetical protein
MGNRAPGYEQFPFDFAWWFIGGKDQVTGRIVPGAIRLGNQPTGGQQNWDIPVLAFDKMAQDYMQNREKRPGQPVQFADGTVHEVSYRLLDDDADLWQQVGCKPSAPEDPPLTLVFKDGQRMENVPRTFYEQLLAAHIQRRTQEPTVTIQLNPNDPNSKLPPMSFLNYDAVCKDFMRRRSDLLAVNWWPELLIQERALDPSNPGPMPVDGRPNALGAGVQVMTPEQSQQQGPGPAPHPGLDNEGGLV